MSTLIIRLRTICIATTVLTGLLLGGCTSSQVAQNGSSLNDNESDTQINYKGAANANVELGLAYIQKERMPEAKAALLRAASEDPSLPAVWYSLAYYYEATQDTKKADQYYRKAIAMAPNAGAPRNNYGTFLCRHKRYQEAISEFTQAAQAPNYLNTAAAYENAGLCSYAIPNNTQALKYFKLALNNDPRRTTSMLYIAKIYQQLGDVTDARRYYKQFQGVATTKDLQSPDAQALAESLGMTTATS